MSLENKSLSCHILTSDGVMFLTGIRCTVLTIFYNRKICTYLRWSSVLKQMYIVPIQKLDEIMNKHFGSGDAQTQSTNGEAELQQQSLADDIDEVRRKGKPHLTGKK